MLKFSLPLPLFLVNWLFPGLLQRAEAHGLASQSWRSKNCIIEMTATVTTAEE